MVRILFALVASVLCAAGHAQVVTRVVDIPTRPNVTQRLLVLTPPQPRATVILFAGGHGGLQLGPDGSMQWGKGNFLVRSRERFAAKGLRVAVIDAPSDQQRFPFLQGFRQTTEHAADVKATLAWLRAQGEGPVWLVGTSRGTQSAAYAATALAGGDGPDGIVLTSTVLRDPRSRPVPSMPVDALRIPVLVVHHEGDTCRVCAFADVPLLMDKLAPLKDKALRTFKGGRDEGDPCEAFAHHGYNGIEDEVVAAIADWILARR